MIGLLHSTIGQRDFSIETNLAVKDGKSGHMHIVFSRLETAQPIFLPARTEF
jgi:hypothetical protein